VVSSPDSQPESLGFDPRQPSTCAGRTKPAILSGSANLYQFWMALIEGSAPLIGPYRFDIRRVSSVRIFNFNTVRDSSDSLVSKSLVNFNANNHPLNKLSPAPLRLYVERVDHPNSRVGVLCFLDV